MSNFESKIEVFTHDNSFLLDPDNNKDNITYALILLKTPFGEYLSPLWERAQFVVSCDGAANQLFAREDKDKLLPEVLIGDMDSITQPVSDYYKDKKVKILQVIDQDKTDMMKAIEYILAKPSTSQPEVIVVYGGFTGRFDHLMGNINALHMYGTSRRIILLQEGKLVELIVPGKHTIHCNRKEVEVACGLIPFTGAARVTSTGLKWNLNGQETNFGGLVSTSNITQGSVVTVETDRPLIWNTAFGSHKKRARDDR